MQSTAAMSQAPPTHFVASAVAGRGVSGALAAGDVAVGAAGRRGKKRPLDEAAGERPVKRKRLAQASVHCMRELFRAVIKDGGVTNEERKVLQTVATLLSQVHGDQWIHLPDCSGPVREFGGTRHQLQKLNGFLERVADELKARETHFEVEAEDSLEFLGLDAVPWADGITARELLACCGPEVELDDAGWNGLLAKLTEVLPSQYMFRARVRELINYYKYSRIRPPEPALAHDAPSSNAASAARKPSVVVSGLRRAAAATLPAARKIHSCVVFAVRSASAAVAAVVLVVAHIFVSLISRIGGCFSWGRGPMLPAIRFFILALLYRPAKRFLEIIVLIARLRAILCLASCNELCGRVLQPLVFVAKKFLRWNEESWILGCSCGDDVHPSLLSLVPVRAAQLIAQSVRLLPVSSDALASLADAVQPVLVFVFEIIFSFGIAEGLAMLVRWANRNAETQLMLMSMSIARTLREGPHHAEEAQQVPLAATTADFVPPLGSLSSFVSSSSASSSPSWPQRSELSGLSVGDAVPVWRDDGAWNLFDS